jgi:hypothetical protein
MRNLPKFVIFAISAPLQDFSAQIPYLMGYNRKTKCYIVLSFQIQSL